MLKIEDVVNFKPDENSPKNQETTQFCGRIVLNAERAGLEEGQMMTACINVLIHHGLRLNPADAEEKINREGLALALEEAVRLLRSDEYWKGKTHA